MTTIVKECKQSEGESQEFPQGSQVQNTLGLNSDKDFQVAIDDLVEHDQRVAGSAIVEHGLDMEEHERIIKLDS